jgi:signal transduction histidine kinase
MFTMLMMSYLFYHHMNKQIEEKNALLMEFKTFAGNTIHQARTPLSVIKIAHTMIDDNAHEEVKLHILSSLVSMEHLYDSLAFALQNEAIDLSPVTLNLSSILQNRVNLFTPVASTMDTKIMATIENAIEISMNQNEIEYLIDNNISNALKYGHPFKPITVTLSKLHNVSVLLFESYGEKISDTHAIFERYARQDRSKQGSGIGLHIVSSICKRYKIAIEVTYEEGKNCFRYIF